ncbi:MAG: DUF2059 domain-containing protein, partial [Sneathiella sp.]
MTFLKPLFSLSALLLLVTLTGPVSASEDAKKEKLIQEFIEITGMRKNVVILTRDLLKLELQKKFASNPKVSSDLLNEMYLILSETFEESADDIIIPIGQLYAETFTADELREIIRFQSSAVGQKAARLMPILTQKGMVLGAKWGADVNKLAVGRIR